MAGLHWSTTPGDAYKELYDAYVKAIDDGVNDIMNRFRPDVETYMKSNAPWKDRSGNARQALWAEMERIVRVMIAINFGQGHGIEYGVYLEFKNAGRFAIVNPTLDYFAPKIWAAIQGMLRK